MKTAKQILIENDCYQDGIRYSLQGRIISTDVERFEKAMKQYAKQALNDAIEKCEICCNNFHPTITKAELQEIKNQLT